MLHNLITSIHWRWILVPLWSLLIASIPFLGHSYLTAKLQSIGFEGVSINPPLYTLVYYFLVAATEPISNLVQKFPDFILSISKVTILTGIIFFLTFHYFFYILGKKESKKLEGSPANQNQVRQISFKKKMIDVITQPKLTVATSVLISIVSVTTAFVTFFLIATILFAITIGLASLWLLALFGVQSGTEAGRQELLNHPICQEPAYLESGVYLNCSSIRIEDNWEVGKRIYSDSQVTFFITPTHLYQLDGAGNLLFARAYE